MGLGDDLWEQTQSTIWSLIKLIIGGLWESVKFMFGQILTLFTKRGKF